MKEVSAENQQSVKCAKVLFSICLLMVMAIWLLNRSIAEHRVQRESERARYYKAEAMLSKLKALNNKNASFFEDLTWCAISGSSRYIDVYRTFEGGDTVSYHFSSYAPTEVSGSGLFEAIREFPQPQQKSSPLNGVQNGDLST